MKHPQNPGSSASQTTESSHQFLQDSSLFTRLPEEQVMAEVKFMRVKLREID